MARITSAPPKIANVPAPRIAPVLPIPSSHLPNPPIPALAPGGVGTVGALVNLPAVSLVLLPNILVIDPPNASPIFPIPPPFIRPPIAPPTNTAPIAPVNPTMAAVKKLTAPRNESILALSVVIDLMLSASVVVLPVDPLFAVVCF